MEGCSRRWDWRGFEFYSEAIEGFWGMVLCYLHYALLGSIVSQQLQAADEETIHYQGQLNQDLFCSFCSQNKKSGGEQAKAGAASPESHQGLRFFPAPCFTSLSLRFLSSFSQEAVSPLGRKKSSFQLNSNTVTWIENPSTGLRLIGQKWIAGSLGSLCCVYGCMPVCVFYYFTEV